MPRGARELSRSAQHGRRTARLAVVAVGAIAESPRRERADVLCTGARVGDACCQRGGVATHGAPGPTPRWACAVS